MTPVRRQQLGDELRRRRQERGLTQSAMGSPLTRAFVSAVEHGRAVPSLPALDHMLRRVDTPLSEFFAAIERLEVEHGLTVAYHHGHERPASPDPPPGRGGPA